MTLDTLHWPPCRPPGALTPAQLRLAHDWMREHLHTPISIADVAQQVGLSPSHFARAFRASTGVPPHRWLLQRRVELAVELLQTQDGTLGDIAAACGFADQSHFCRVFARAQGVPPSRWRATEALA